MYFALKSKQDLDKEQIPSNPKAFVEGLKTVFGSGSAPIERSIISEIDQEFNISTQSDSLLHAIRDAKIQSD